MTVFNQSQTSRSPFIKSGAGETGVHAAHGQKRKTESLVTHRLRGAARRCVLNRDGEVQPADRQSTGTRRRALRQQHYRSEVKCASTSLWESDTQLNCNRRPGAACCRQLKRPFIVCESINCASLMRMVVAGLQRGNCFSIPLGFIAEWNN